MSSSPISTEAPAIAGAERGRGSRVSMLVLLVVGLAALALRVIATHNDLWLDEIISLEAVRSLKSIGEVFTAIHSDNNHYLNSLYLYLAGSPANDAVYRYFSVVCGVLTVAAGYWAAAPRGKGTALLFTALLAFSYPLIHFSSEARGYSGMILGAVVALGAAIRWMEKRSVGTEILYAVGISFALLSHLTACLVWASMALAMLAFVLARKRRLSGLLRLAAMNILPAGVMAFLYLADLRYLSPLGGPNMSLTHGLSRMVALSLGWPLKDDTSGMIVIGVVAAVMLWELWRRRSAGDSWVLMMIMLAPLACAMTVHSSFFMPRYFLFTVPFLYFAMALVLARWWPLPAGKFIVPVVLTLFLSGQTLSYLSFLHVGRGQISSALRAMGAETLGPTVILTSNQDFRATTECRYFQNAAPGKKILYVRSQDAGWLMPQWCVLHGEGYDPQGPSLLNVGAPDPWYRVGYFGASELSGQAWTVYSPRHIELQTGR